jgi:hypothetical protein
MGFSWMESVAKATKYAQQGLGAGSRILRDPCLILQEWP